MKSFKFIIINIVETLLRMLPLPRRPGLLKIGRPSRNSPVFLTGNYHLTVERVRRSLRGSDAYLLIADSRGINVWCAAAGGHLTAHDVISVLKTSGIEAAVDHRTVILPQLAAAGVEGGMIEKRTGWKVIWGPVYARDIGRFIKNGFHKPSAMREVGFPAGARLEMAAAWAFPISLVSALPAALFWPGAVLPLAALIWGLSLLIFLSFPLYERRLRGEGRRVGLVLFDFGRSGFQLILWLLFIVGLIAYGGWSGDLSGGFILRWGFVSLALLAVLSLDLRGSTPVFKSGLHEERLFEVVLNEDRCRGAAICREVCPRNCCRVDPLRRRATPPGASRCVRCGACVVQCPLNALSFRTPAGEIIPPDVIRKFKLNLRGRRH